MAKKICEQTRNGVPVEMVMDADFITVRVKKQNGRKRDKDHDLNIFYEVEPYLREEILGRSSIFAPMSSFLQSFIQQVWEEAEELDPWYIENEDSVDDEQEQEQYQLAMAN